MENNEQKPQVNNKLKYIMIAVVAVLVVAVTFIVLNFSKDESKTDTGNSFVSSTENVDDKSSENDTTTQDSNPENSNSENSETSGSSNSDTAGTQDNAESKTYTPTFMYFVSKNDNGYAEYMKMVDELKTQYGDSIKFDIVDVDENPESKKNFPVDGNTPTLIMTDTNNDISAIEFKCSDKSRLTADIDAALNK